MNFKSLIQTRNKLAVVSLIINIFLFTAVTLILMSYASAYIVSPNARPVDNPLTQSHPNEPVDVVSNNSSNAEEVLLVVAEKITQKLEKYVTSEGNIDYRISGEEAGTNSSLSELLSSSSSNLPVILIIAVALIVIALVVLAYVIFSDSGGI